MSITTTPYKRCVVVKMDGRIDSHSAPDLKKIMDDVIENDQYKLVFDMSEVAFISSRGIWVLIETQKSCKRYNRGQLSLACVPDQIMESFDLAGLKDLFPFFETVVDAVGSY
ncbi:MAG: STAS domain-containing protein [Anaerolineales bacterium]|nr:STAS domain-containing protein [Anaerolineales bacterium]